MGKIKRSKIGKPLRKAAGNPKFVVGIKWILIIVIWLTGMFVFQTVITSIKLLNFLFTLNGALPYVDVVIGIAVIMLFFMTVDITWE